MLNQRFKNFTCKSNLDAMYAKQFDKQNNSLSVEKLAQIFEAIHPASFYETLAEAKT